MRRARPKRLTVLVAGCDEYTVLLVARHLPDARLLTAAGRRRPDLAIIEASDVTAVQAVERQRPANVVVLSDSPNARIPFAGRLVTRPFSPGALFDAIDDELQRPAQDKIRPTVLAAVRFALITLGAGVHGFGDGTFPDLMLAFGALTYGAARLLSTRFEREARIADAAFACILVAATGGAGSGFVPFATLTVVAAGVSLGWRTGAVAGGLVSLAAGTPTVIAAVVGRADMTQAFALLALFPLAGMTGGLARRLHATSAQREILTETNRLLSRLHGIAREIPGGMDAQTVATAILEELRELGLPAAAVIDADEDDQLRVRAGFGVPAGRVDGGSMLRATTSVRVLDVDRAAEPLRRTLRDHSRWIVAPAARNARIHGILVAAVPSGGLESASLAALTRLSGDAAVAFENAELLRRVGALAADEERRRIAMRVHDGLAQTLTHLRLELDFIARHGNDGSRIREELGRMSSVLDRAIGDVHGLMHDLKTDQTETSEPPAEAPAPEPGKERMPA